ncbi:putative glycerophosphoryl diester phosphodiesterase 1 [Planctomycetes bacterium K2D]|uniref:Putative glycerophosphoryl diester phosphodiesterase 1 n=3 Tax=Botrimarina mediterranea TaxID=2528022 RepID=A0A518K7Z1_9BACT|nr:putative glycerophosphoryl diester phosphodiesterase 1 [Botrimarina mediterranea]QDV78542.1 putative glycerophosphoryl diester phosphodiesterase 1 [Planctomycetes bacterium K2D]
MTLNRSLLPLALAMGLSLASGAAQAQLITAHRGASYDAPENTLAAFKLAWEQGADAFEGDFYLTADGKIVCGHDKDAKRVAGSPLVMEKSTADELRALDVGSWKGAQWKGERMPLFKDVLDVVGDGRIFVEIKSGPKIVAPLLKQLGESGIPEDRITIICFNEAVTAECERLAPQIKTHWLTGFKKQKDGAWAPSVDEVLAKLKASRADGFGVQANPEHVDAEFLAKLADEGYDEFHVWTVDDADVARYYQKLGAWGITTNRPAWLREQLGLRKQLGLREKQHGLRAGGQ